DAPAVELLVTAPGRPLADLRHWTEDSLLPQFLGLAGIAGARVDGGPVREIKVVPDQRRLDGLGLALDDVVAAVRQAEAQSPNGALVAAARAGSAAVGALPVRLASGDTLSLSEVASVRESDDNAGPAVRFDAMPAVRLVLTQVPGRSPVAVADAVKARLDWLRANGLIAEGTQVRMFAPQARSLEYLLRRFYSLAAGGLMLVLAVVLVSGGTARASLPQVLAALVSLPASGVFLAVAGITLNLMSLAGLVIAGGLCLSVPLAVHESASPFRPSAAPGAQAAAHSALGIVLPSLVILLLLLTIPGPIGLLCRDLVAVIVLVLSLSWIITVTLARGWLQRPPRFAARSKHDRRRSRTALGAYYRAWMRAAITRPGFIAAVALALLSGTVVYGGYLARRAEFLPSPSTGEIRVRLNAADFAAGKRLDRAMPMIERLAREQGGVVRLISVQEAPPFSSAELRIELEPRLQRAANAERWIVRFEQAVAQAQLRDIRVRATVVAFPGVSSDYGDDPLLRAADGEIGAQVTGPDRLVLARLGERVVHILRALPNVRDVHVAADAVTHDFVLHMDPVLAAERGVDEAQAARAVRIARGGLVVGAILDGDHRLDIRVTLALGAGAATAPLNLLLRGETRHHPAVYLGDVATVDSVREADQLSRDGWQPVIAVNGVCAADRSTGQVVSEIEQRVGRLVLPEGYRLSFTGVAAGIAQDATEMFWLVVLGTPLLAAALALRYRGWRRPLIVLLSAPFSLVGVVAALGLSDQVLSLPGWLGAILAVGVAGGMATLSLDLMDRRLAHYRRRARAAVATAAAGVRLAIVRLGGSAVAGAALLAMIGAPELALLRPFAVVFIGGTLAAVATSILWTPVLYGILLADHVMPGSARRGRKGGGPHGRSRARE
ncbi:MAG: efflux RND transporter permease subunit, partial [Terriglobales bacterium]